jgi:hypothetical protein
MKRLQIAVSLLCLALIGVLWAPMARASEWNEKTIETFHEPVEIPGRVLPKGTYVFRLLDSSGDRDIVQIFNAKQTKLYATILAIPDYRLRSSDKPVIRFEERKSTSPEAVKAWFYPGRLFGEEFVYPESRARVIAKRTHQNVLSMRNALAKNITKPTKTAKEPQVMAMKQATVQAISPTGKKMDMNQVVASHR